MLMNAIRPFWDGNKSGLSVQVELYLPPFQIGMYVV